MFLGFCHSVASQGVSGRKEEKLFPNFEFKKVKNQVVVND